MNREQAKEYIKNLEPDFLQPARQKINGNTSYICPNCGNGTGSSGTGIALDPHAIGKKYKCFKCGLHEDIIGLWKAAKGIEDDAEAFKSIYEHYGITVDQEPPAQALQATAAIKKKPEPEEPEEDYTAFFLEANRNIENTCYHRGLKLETLNRFKIGYIENWKHPKATKAPGSPRLIIPTSKHSYLARDTRTTLTEEEKKYSKSKVGKISFFNSKSLEKSDKSIFIVEGEIDALSIIDVGGEALALGSTAYINKFLELIKEHRPKHPLILALDNDAAGEKATEELKNALEKLKIPFYKINIYGENKDANAALLADKKQFADKVKEAENSEIKEYKKNSAATYIQDFINGIADSANTNFISTGFNNLDQELDGGLYEGLYVVGAISSLGKTTLITQIADQIAQSGQDVLIFSLEMARYEIMAKSISRLTLLDAVKNKISTKSAKTTRGITTGKRYSNYSKEEIEIIQRAISSYSEFADNIYIYEGIGDIGVEDIRKTVKKHISITGNKPVIIIDYLQILAPADIRATDKQNTDKAILELKRISRDYKIPVIGISSFNRANYSQTVTMEAFKESGAIEYSSDVLIGLQLKGAGESNFNVTEAKKKNPREIELVILKNRNGSTGGKISMAYYPMFNYFTEIGE